MPRENKKRGRREAEKEKKRKRAEFDDEDSIDDSKRQRVSEEPKYETEIYDEPNSKASVGEDYIALDLPIENNYLDPSQDYHGEAYSDYQPPVDQRTIFYGLLTQEEQDYYAGVNSKLDANDFQSPEDLDLFVEAVHRESQGKELKVACSQSSSRYLERIVNLSTPAQVKALLKAFLDHLTSLVCHRFASHVIESVLLKGAESVGKDEKEDDKSMEGLFTEVARQLKPDIGYLMTEKFATHVVRTLMLILSGESLNSDFSRKILGQKRKDAAETRDAATGDRYVPQSFQATLSELIEGPVAGLQTSYARSLATSPTGSPVMQLLLRFELTVAGKQKVKDDNSLFKRLLPDDSFEDDTENAKFILGLIYDPTGSRLIEVLIQNLPGKTFKKLYRSIIKSRLSDLSKNEIASHVASRALERLGKADLDEALELIAPELPADILRNQLTVLRTLIDRINIREANPVPVLEALRISYGEDPVLRLPRMLRLDTAPERETGGAEKKTGEVEKTKQKSAVDTHGSLLAQSILQAPSFCDFLHKSLLELDAVLLLALCRDRSGTYIIQIALTSPQSPPAFLRQFCRCIEPHAVEIATDPIGSHVVDALWTATSRSTGLHFIKESIASNLASAESQLRESIPGRMIWRNWALDLYRRRPREWQALAKGGDNVDREEHSTRRADTGGPKTSVAAFSQGKKADDKENHPTANRAKVRTPIELASERYLARQQAKNRRAAH